jgi:hypothetical protein
MYTTDTSKMTKAIIVSMMRTKPLVLILANVIIKEAKIISPIPMKEAHILSMLLN